MDKLIITYLKTNGGALDLDIAQALKLPLNEVKRALEELSAKRKAISCAITKYIAGREILATSWRLLGTIPEAARGPKVGAKVAGKADNLAFEDD